MNSLALPTLIAKNDGTPVQENRQWQSRTENLNSYRNEWIQAIHQAVQSGHEVRLGCSPYEFVCTLLQGESEQLFLLQACENHARSADSLQKELEATAQSSAAYREKLSSFGMSDCIANSNSMIRVFTKAKQIAAYPTTVLLLGETGVGKEVISSFIHNNSDRAGKPFIKINCSAIPEPLMESELFGYESGAFTGARAKGKIGLFELANYGTVLLDEIGDMNQAMQAKLLRTLQEGEIVRLGSDKTIHLDVRIISATSRDIDAMMQQGQFLDALYYRLNVVELRIPPLRERREDILPLAEYYLQYFCDKYKLSHEFSSDVREAFLHYDWPGNVRELRNMVENLTVSSIEARIDLGNLPARMSGRTRSPDGGTRQHVQGKPLKEAVEALQKEMILDALHASGSLRKAAVTLEIDPMTLYRLAKKLGVEN